MSHRFGKSLVWLALPAAVAAGWLLLRWWQGPSLPAYRLEPRPLIQNVVATGRVISTSRAQVGSEITAVVVERHVKEGDAVAPGDLLISLRADDLVAKVREAEAALNELQQARRPQAQAALRQAEAQLLQATRESERRRSLLASRLISNELKEQAEQAETNARAAAEQARLLAGSLAAGQSEERVLRERLAAARATLAKTQIRANVAGTVLTRNVEPGDLVQPGRVLLEVARAGDTELLVPVDEKNLALLALGQQAKVIADAYPDRVFGATVSFIAPSVDPLRGTVEVRLKVAPVPDYLKQDMTVSATVETGRRETALVVPNDALTSRNANRGTVLAVRGGKVVRADVQLGLRGTALSEVLDGVSAGDWVLEGASVAEGKRVRVSEQPLPAGSPGVDSSKELPVRFD
ncbi:MAG: efflux RND transporter periplasmic adaptor subunit [Steroidobacteraceae bacterium]